MEKACTHPAEVASALLGHDPRGAQVQKMPCCWFACQHFIDGQGDLPRLQFWSEVAQVLQGTGRLCPSSKEHALLIRP